MATKILIPLDGSSLAERALSQVRWLWQPETTEVILLRVVEPWNYYYGAEVYNPPEVVASLCNSARAYLQAQAEGLKSEGYATSTEVLGGNAEEAILELALSENVDFIVMSTHGRSGFVRWALGSVAERVIQGATMPILLVREPVPVPVNRPARLLVPLDGSELSELALPKAEEIAKSQGAEILLLHVVDTPVKEQMHLLVESVETLAAIVETWETDVRAYLDSLAQRVRADGIKVATQVEHGDPSKVIGRVAAEDQIDLVVMSTHGRTGFSRWFYGSVANKVLRGVNCPLLLVRATPAEVGESLDMSEVVSLQEPI